MSEIDNGNTSDKPIDNPIDTPKTTPSGRAASSKRRINSMQRRFLAAYAECGTVTYAAKASGVSRRSHSNWMLRDPEYAAAFAEAHEQANEALENEARRRAIEGVEEPAGWYQGKPGGYVKRYSDMLLMFLLNANAPHKFKHRQTIEHTGPAGGPVRIKAEELTDDELATIAQRSSERITLTPGGETEPA